MISDWWLNHLPEWLVMLYWEVRIWVGMHFFWRCEKCGRRGCTENGAVDFVSCLCQKCYERLLAEYIQAMTRPEEEVGAET